MSGELREPDCILPTLPPVAEATCVFVTKSIPLKSRMPALGFNSACPNLHLIVKYES